MWFPVIRFEERRDAVELTKIRVPASRGGAPGSGGVGPQVGAVRARNRRRQAAGLAVAGVCTLSMAGLWVGAGQRTAVLELVRPVAVGQVIATGDVRTVLVGADDGVPLIAAGRRDTVVGSTVSGSLPAGTLLTAQMLGALTVPAGSVTLALPVKEGQYPPRLNAGATVALYPSGTNTAPTASTAASGTGSVGVLAQGVVLEVDPSQAGDGAAVLTVQVPQSAAGAIAQTPAVDVVELPAGSNTGMGAAVVAQGGGS